MVVVSCSALSELSALRVVAVRAASVLLWRGSAAFFRQQLLVSSPSICASSIATTRSLAEPGKLTRRRA